MCVHKLNWGIFGAGLIVLLSAACTQMDTVLPSTGTYQVDAINGGFSLNEYSVIAAGDTVCPYFANPVVDDPDLRTLVLYVEDSHGEILGGKIIYSLNTVPARPVLSKVLPNPAEALEEETEGEDKENEVDEESAETGAVFPDDDITIPVKNFTGKLPPFPLPEELEIGAYSLVFEIRGEHTVLNRTNQPFYYIGGQKFTAGEIRHYLPEFHGNSHLVSPGLTVMLETQVEYGKELDPYIIWYNGKNRIGEGFAAAGAIRLLWTVPLRSGFYTIRAELFPFKPRAGQRGKVKEFSLPVSQKNETSSGPAAGDYLYWYRFAGNLLDTKTGKGLNLVQGDKVSSSWYPADQVYGLALDEGESYEAPRYFLELPKDGGGELGFFIRFLPLKNGRIFSARLGSSLTVSLFLEDGTLLLDLKEQGQGSRISKVLPESGRGFTGVFITVKLDKLRAGASLVLGTPDKTESPWPETEAESGDTLIQAPTEWAEIELSQPLSGELRSWIGAETEKVSKPEKEGRDKSPAPNSPSESAVSLSV
ncbi:MAG: hypothetical protein LBU19_04360, partial [Treponema sp.]|nr:hypothetical protein [Treponema sp.]